MRDPLIFALLSLVCCITSCSNHRQQEELNHAESLMEAHPDSALTILRGMEQSELESKEKQARYALLLSMALDKNYIDTTTFDVLQPAIEYYIESGNPTEKLRTYYYQGRIFQNQGERDNALKSFIKAIDISPEANDSLCIARALVAQGGLYNDFYDFESYTNCHLKAARIYSNLSLDDNEFDCLLNALNGAIATGNKIQADTLQSICNSFKKISTSDKSRFDNYQLSNALRFDDTLMINQLITRLRNINTFSHDILLNLALAYNKIGDNLKAQQLLEQVRDLGDYDTLKYLAISVPILENSNNYKDALTSYKVFSHTMDSINTLRFDQKAKSVEDIHGMELDAQQEARKKSKLIWGCIGGGIFLSMIIIILFLLFRSNKIQKGLAIERARTSELENEMLKSDCDRKALLAENLAHRVKELKNENDSLKELMDSKDELPIEVRQAIQVRIEMLNALIAGHITDNSQYEKPYDLWIREHTENIEEFMNSNRLAFQASHPRFIQYFEAHDLTPNEINYVCLYALGLRGKEVGLYIKKRSHVNMSSGIRKKLGIDKHETNIGIYVRKLLKEL